MGIAEAIKHIAAYDLPDNSEKACLHAFPVNTIRCSKTFCTEKIEQAQKHLLSNTRNHNQLERKTTATPNVRQAIPFQTTSIRYRQKPAVLDLHDSHAA